MLRFETLQSDYSLGKKFEELKQDEEKLQSRHSDMMVKHTKYDDGSTYIFKKFKPGDVPHYEVVAQEIFRLLIPEQPAYRVVFDKKGELKGVLSEFIDGNQLKDNHEGEELVVGKCKNLGKIQVGSLFVEEADLRAANFIRKNGELYKIDGDWSFASLHKGTVINPTTGLIESRFINPNIVAEHLLKLPFIHDDKNCFNPFNWIGHKDQEILVPEEKLTFLKKIKEDKYFQREINETLLKIILLSDDMIKKIVDQHVIRFPGDEKIVGFQTRSLSSIREKDQRIQQELTNLLIKKRDVFLELALKNENFIRYFLEHGNSDAKLFISYVQKFKINGVQVLKEESKAIQDKLRNLSDQWPMKKMHHIKKITGEINRLIQLSSSKSGFALPNDAKIDVYRDCFDDTLLLETKLSQIEERFKITLAPEVRKNRFAKIESLLTALDEMNKINETDFDPQILSAVSKSIIKVSSLSEIGYFNTFLRKTTLKTSKTEEILDDLQKDLKLENSVRSTKKSTH